MLTHFEQYSSLELQLGALAACLITTLILFSARSKMDAYCLLTKVRRSVGKPELYTGVPVPKNIITKGLECAIRAPNHFLSEPWRFRLLNNEQKDLIVKLTKFDGKKPLFQRVPQMMVVSMVPSTGKKDWGDIKAMEDHAATACAVQNFMIYLASEGYGTKWMTGAMGMDGTQILSEVCNLNDEALNREHFMGVLIMGEPSHPLDTIKVPERKKGLNDEIFTQF
jgi:nitroreductase